MERMMAVAEIAINMTRLFFDIESPLSKVLVTIKYVVLIVKVYL